MANEHLEIFNDFHNFVQTGNRSHIEKYSEERVLWALGQAVVHDKHNRWFHEMEKYVEQCRVNRVKLAEEKKTKRQKFLDLILLNLPLTIIATILAACILGYFRIPQFFSKADLRFEFGTPEAVRYQIVNSSKNVADEPSWGFGIFDLNTKTTVPIPVQGDNYIRGRDQKGPWSLLHDLGQKNHRYFGYGFVTCKNCEKQRAYWIYSDMGDHPIAWTIETDRDAKWDAKSLLNDPNAYLRLNFPETKRTSVEENVDF